ncbi:MAG: TIGR01777 family oxidoreductase [Candidatus Polarisedimenticolaceae bacterium]|nr:TIGR01777 family oxidoreductase [Candidatus Polarisedimenticolaceae bacterium]
MKILITGGTGFIGTPLCHKLLAAGHTLTVLSRSASRVKERCGRSVTALQSLESLSAEDSFDAIINLAGEPIADARWSEARKVQLMESRIGITQQLIDYIKRAKQKPSVLISGSAVGYYGDSGDQPLDESSPFHDEFTHHLCHDWEAAASKAEAEGVRLCLLRTGLVVGRNGGFLAKMLLPFKLCLGGRLGDGKQWMSWVHLDDLVNLILHLLNHSELDGPFNGTAPNPVSNAEFTRTLAHSLHRIAPIPIPAITLKVAMGEMSRLLLTGQRVMPKRALDSGFKFQFEQLSSALNDVLNR